MVTTLTLQPFNKLPLSTTQLIRKLQTQSLTINNISKAEEFLKRVNYYRFRGYLYPYLDLGSPPNAAGHKQFKPGSTFERAIEIYNFDSELRILILNLLNEVEVGIRTVLDRTIIDTTDQIFWLFNEELFINRRYPRSIITSLSNSFNSSREEYAKHYRVNYFNNHSEEYKNLPPFWMLCELSSIGQLYEIINNLDPMSHEFPASTSGATSNTVLDRMAQNNFGANNYNHFVKWLQTLRNVRNTAAHHNRLWNRNFAAPPGLIGKTSIPFPTVAGGYKTNTVYAAIIAMRIICKKLGVSYDIRYELLRLFSKYPESSSADSFSSMGIPNDWHLDLIWN